MPAASDNTRHLAEPDIELNDDTARTNDLAAQEPYRLKRVQELWMIEAVRNNVLPLNASQIAVFRVERPGPAAGRKQFVYTTRKLTCPVWMVEPLKV